MRLYLGSNLRMNILFSAQNFLNEVGGAEISAQTLLRELAKHHNVQVLSRGEPKSYKWGDIDVLQVSCPNNIGYINMFWQKYLNRLDFRPDLVITQVNAAAPTVFWAKNQGIPVVFYVRSFEHFCLDSFKQKTDFQCGQRCYSCGGSKDKLLYPIYRSIFDRNRQAIQKADLVICQTHFMADLVAHFTGVSAEIITNPMDLDSVKVEKSGEEILFVKPLKHKGVELVSKLVRKLPHRKFLLVGENEPEYDWLLREENVQSLGNISDMRQAYSRAKVILAPSIMADSSPMVIFEANISGIPAIASNVGGAAEVAGDDNVKIRTNDVEGWAQEIEKLYMDRLYYQKRSKDAERNAQRHSLKRSLKELSDVFMERLKIRLNLGDELE